MLKVANITSRYRARLIASAYKKWLKKGDKVLDAGCGTGVVAKELENLLDLRIYGCDIENYLVVKIPFKKMPSDFLLPKYGYKFNAVMFNDTLHHTQFSNQENLIMQVLKISDNVLLFELKPTIVNRIFDYLINKIHYKNLDIPFTYRSEKQWEKLFKKMGLTFKKKILQRPLLYPFSHIAYKISK